MKMYYFSTKKHAHDIELYNDYLTTVLHDLDLEDSKKPEDIARYNKCSAMKYGKLNELLMALKDTPEYYGQPARLTGEQLALAKQIVVWADAYRENANRA